MQWANRRDDVHCPIDKSIQVLVGIQYGVPTHTSVSDSNVLARILTHAAHIPNVR